VTARLLSLAAAILARLGFLRRPGLAVLMPPVPAAVVFPHAAWMPRLSLGLPGDWTPMTGGEP
jgi:hypothetical protein